MDENSLDELLRQRAQKTGGSLPPNFQQNVWREIRQRRAAETAGSGAWVWQWLLRPQLVAVVLAVAMAVGAGLGSRHPERVELNTNKALDLDVFGASPRTLPSTVLSARL